MEKAITDEQLIELIEGKRSADLEQAIQLNTKLKARFEELKEVMDAIDQAGDAEVPSHVGRNFQEAIDKEKGKKTKGFSYLQVAAAIAILIVGFELGKFSGGNNNASAELADLRSEIQSLREVTLTSALQRHSASERIMAVNRIEEKRSINRELLSTLITTLNSDESPNVRYAALQALQKFIGDYTVRTELVKSLEAQSDPLIQISLIAILVEAEEKSAIAPLRDMINNEKIAPEVKQQAKVALKVLT